jgi:hypothetical protein
MRAPLVLVLALFACKAGELHPFASGGAASGSGGGSGEDGSATDSGGIAASTGMVYARCPRTLAPLEIEGDVVAADGSTSHLTRTMGHADVYDELPRTGSFGGFVAPCDLVLASDDGSEEVLFDCTSIASVTRTCAAIEPAVSFDGRSIAFSVWWGPIEHRELLALPQLLDPDAEGGDEAWTPLPNPVLAPTDAELHVIDLVTGDDTVLPHEAGTFDTAPAFLADGRIAFTSTRGGLRGTAVHVGNDPWSTSTEERVAQLYSIAPDGRDLARVGTHGLAGELHPLQLVDGRVAFVSRQLFGMLPYRYTNGSNGAAGAIGASFHVYAEDPDGARLTPLWGQHTHIVGAPDFDHGASQRMTQAADGRLIVAEGGGPFGAGRIYAFAPRDDGREGLPPSTDIDVGDVLRPPDLENLVPWGGRGGSFSGPMPAPEVHSPAYGDPIVYTGFARDPEALADGALAIVWTKGACSDVAGAHESLFGPDPPPLTSGSGAFTAMNALDLLGRDSPGCDAGIYRIAAPPSEHPSDLELVVDSPEFHEIMPRRVQPYGDLHGVPVPAVIAPAHARAESSDHLPSATPFALFGASSLLLRETRSVDGHPFAGEIQWALQGTDTVDYDDDEICGLRILAVQPNRPDEPGVARLPAGLRTLVLAEVPARKRDEDGEVVVDPLEEPDTSVRLRMPADLPVLVQGIDCDGRTLSTSQTPLSLRPGEDLRCDGCHVRSRPGLPFDDTAAALADYDVHGAGEGIVQLLAGSDGDEVATREVESWGLAYEFERDVWPILQSRCVSCHAGDTAAAGLVLDVAGIESGSTWWRLAADESQTYVPADLAAPGGGLRKPQLTKYVRFMNARGSLLYWKAANERTDGRTDGTFADDASDGFADVDFGASHPTDITAEELAVLARWIDTGAAAGAGVHADATAPTLAIRMDDGGDLLVGTVDVGSGIDPASLAICSVAPTGACSAIDVPLAAEAGVVSVALPDLGDDAELRVRVRDRAGNETVVQRSLAAEGMLAPEDDDGGPDDGPDLDDDDDDDGAGCGCTTGPRSSAANVILIAWLLRRRRSRST